MCPSLRILISLWVLVSSSMTSWHSRSENCFKRSGQSLETVWWLRRVSRSKRSHRWLLSCTLSWWAYLSPPSSCHLSRLSSSLAASTGCPQQWRSCSVCLSFSARLCASRTPATSRETLRLTSFRCLTSLMQAHSALSAMSFARRGAVTVIIAIDVLTDLIITAPGWTTASAEATSPSSTPLWPLRASTCSSWLSYLLSVSTTIQLSNPDLILV